MSAGCEILTTAQMRAIETTAMNSGSVTGLQLMERAGRAVADQVRLRWPKAGRATVLCGPGNNGSDGFVVARLLRRAGWRVRVLGMDNRPGPDADHMKRQWLAMGGLEPLDAAVLHAQPADIVVDAIFGTGLARPPSGPLAEVLESLATHPAPVVAVDCPSGLCLDSGAFLGRPRQVSDRDLRARLTVAFDSPKPGHLLERGPECCGELVIADIGLRPWREARTQQPVLTAIWPRFAIPDARCIQDNRLGKQSSSHPHKFSHGHALVLAGGRGKGGAARLSARAALRIGAGLVTIAPPLDALPDHVGQPDALMRRGIDDDAALHDALGDARINALCIGPGSGVNRAEMLLRAALPARRATVLDADALTALSQAADLMGALHPACVLTPHGGEFARLFPDLAGHLDGLPAKGPAYSRLDAARDAAARCGAVVLLKGPDTIIAAPDGQARIHSAFDVPWLATAGAGDVLAGIITGLLARGFQPLDAASLGALIHAKAARAFGPGLIADDLPDMIPQVLRQLTCRSIR
ncbi:bifunctional NAD(P)H-hydrate repair enzyme [Paracoccus acridae]|uniref:Bifunctional NAD(P)H-hydrate repair enzyme n=1 Tax=Paracoccus acridae TaxID=1795310 RepID=A0ABQ1VJM3_9RHOB|nr:MULTISPECIES: NAD(P)H-hydrate dehydratase [Paracoccus]GGF68279.1 bifunctional NAD(P)H-hydrate repair enzyme [Paracoccus acridae]